MANLSNINNKFLVTTGGNVGIGTTSPGSKLVVAGGTDTSYNDGTLKVVGSIALNSANNLNPSLNRWALRPRAAGVEGSFDIYDARHSLSRLTIDDSGNVGIGTGTTSPTSLLQIKKATLPRITLTKTGILDWFIGNPSQGTSNTFSIGTNSGSNTEILNLTNTGDVGIGITTPYTKLVVGSRGTAAAPSILAYDGVAFDFYNDGSPYKRHGVIISQAADTSESVLDFNTKAASGTNSTKMTILGNGDVGIGTASPTEKLHLKSTTNGSFIRFEDNGGSGVYVGARSNDLEFYAGGSEKMVILSGGNVGIGATLPEQKLHVEGRGIFDGGASSDILQIRNDSGGGIFGMTPNLFALDLASTSNFRIRQGSAVPLYLNSNGNLGIGTITPDSKLHVKGISTFEEAGAGAGTQLKLVGQDSSGQFNFLVAKQYNVNNAFEITPSTVANGGVFTNPAFIVNSAGKVGIGTTSPSEILTIPGNYGVGLGYKTFYSSGGTVPAGVGPSYYLVATLNQLQGTTLSSYYQYKFFLTTTQTGTYNSSVYIVYANSNNTAWLVREVSRRGTSSNHPELTVNGTEARIYNDHPSAYPVIYRVETTYSGQANTAPNIFGADYMWQRTTGVLTYTDGNVGIGTTSPDVPLDVEGAIQASESGGDFIRMQTDGTNNIFDVNSGDYVFRTSGFTQRMRITSSGDVLFGKTSQGLSIVGIEAAANATLRATKASSAPGEFNRTGSDGGIVLFYKNTVGVGSISVTASATAYNTSSDYRLKEDLQDFAGLDMVSKIPVYDFKWKSDENRSYGVMAHELQEVLPDAVTGEKDAEEMQGVDYSKIVPLLVKSIQELKAEIELLKSK